MSSTSTPAAARAHIAIVGATAPSHVYPSLGLVRELVRRGHRVTYAIGRPLVELVAPTGAEPIACSTVLPGEGEGSEWPQDPIEGMALFLDEAIHVLPQILHAYGDDRPNVVLHDIGGLAGAVAAAVWGVPAIQLSPTFVAWEGYEDDMAEQLAAMKATPAARRYYTRFEAWLAEHGVEREPDAVLGRPERGLVLIPRVLQPEAERVSPAFRFVGPVLDAARLAESAWSPPAGGAPVLYVSFGTAYTDQPEVYRGVAEQFAGSGWHVVMSVGGHVDPAALGAPRDGFEILRSAPQLAVLEHAAAFVTHAGMGSTMEALWFGVPMVAIPQAVDQFANAARIAELGVGRHVPRDQATPAAIEAAVLEVARDPGIGERLASLSRAVRGEGGAARAADEVEAVIAGV